MHFLRRVDLAHRHFPGVQDLAAQRHDGLRLAIARLLGGAAGGVAFDQEQLGVLRILVGAVGQLAGQRGARGDALALHLLRGLRALLRVLDGELRDALARIRMLVEPQRQRVVHETFDERSRVARREAFLHLAGELRLLDLDRQHEAALVEDVFGRELDAARHEIAEFAEFAHRARDAGAQAVHVRAAFGGRDEIDVALAHRALGIRRPHDARTRRR